MRPAVLEDAQAIARLYVASATAAHRNLLPGAFFEAATQERLEPLWVQRLTEKRQGTFALVADQGGELRGLCFAGPVGEDEGDPALIAELRLVYVAPQWWRQGVGRAMVDAVVKLLRDFGYKELTLWSIEGDEQASAFYSALGWVQDGARERMGTTGPFALRFRRKL